MHRDLKPANIFIVDGEDGPLCKVLDFGIVKLSAAALTRPEGPLTLSGATLGTVCYMSPEQIADAQRVDHRADLWSIGVLAYECLTGRRPFRGESLLGVVHEVCYGVPTPPSRLAEVPPGFDRWFSRATHRDRDRRFTSARELLDALKALTARPASATRDEHRDGHREDHRLDATPSWVSDANQIDIGALKDLTFKAPVVREFLDGATRYFVSGSKGLGKTLLLTYKRALLGEQYQVSTPGRERRQAVQFIPEGRPYLDLMGDLPGVDAAQIDRMSRLDECKRLWSFSFRLSILSYHPTLIGNLDDLDALPRRLRALLEGRPVEPTLVLKELLGLSVRQLSQVLDAMENPLERRLRSLHSGVFIFIDKLDQALRRLPRAAWVHMQAGMIEAAWDLMNANRHVKIYATIRDEAFSGYESDIKSNLYGATSSLRYAKHELRELLEKLTYYYEGLPLYDFVLVDTIYASTGARGESPFDFLYRHTLGRPRDLVILSSEISRHRRGLDARAFIRVVQDTSAGLLVSNIFDEMRVFLEVLSDRDRRARFLALLPHDVLTHDDVAEVWCAFHGVDREYFDRHGRDADDVYHPFRELYECGLLGVLEGDNLQRFRQPHDGVAGSRHELPRSRYYLLHPALRALLDRLAGAGRFRPLRHVLIGHGEAWPAHWNLLVDVQREALRRRDLDAETSEALQTLLDRLDARLAGGDGLDTVRRELAAT
ncbi:MAG TPA: serine/threonine-protein kinase, partial [Nannocystis sp.]